MTAAAKPTAKPVMREQILKLMRQRPVKGWTADEVEERTGWKHQSVSARFLELKNEGAIVPTGASRLTRSRRSAGAWTIAN